MKLFTVTSVVIASYLLPALVFASVLPNADPNPRPDPNGGHTDLPLVDGAHTDAPIAVKDGGHTDAPAVVATDGGHTDAPAPKTTDPLAAAAAGSTTIQKGQQIASDTATFAYKCVDREYIDNVSEKVQEAILQAQPQVDASGVAGNPADSVQGVQGRGKQATDAASGVLLTASEQSCLCQPVDPQAFDGVFRPDMICTLQKGEAQQLIDQGQRQFKVGDKLIAIMREAEA